VCGVNVKCVRVGGNERGKWVWLTIELRGSRWLGGWVDSD
jgi:hypothetical protein